jgi:hypothetical protein
LSCTWKLDVEASSESFFWGEVFMQNCIWPVTACCGVKPPASGPECVRSSGGSSPGRLLSAPLSSRLHHALDAFSLGAGLRTGGSICAAGGVVAHAWRG